MVNFLKRLLISTVIPVFSILPSKIRIWSDHLYPVLALSFSTGRESLSLKVVRLSRKASDWILLPLHYIAQTFTFTWRQIDGFRLKSSTCPVQPSTIVPFIKYVRVLSIQIPNYYWLALFLQNKATPPFKA